jgi:protein-S-isoprenylcysteine O-methyltransferase Ste14
VVAWINVAVLTISAVLCLYFYVKSAGPAALEKKIGPSAYGRCTRYRLFASIFMTVASVNYVIYVFYPLPIALPRTFPWPWWVSAVIAGAIALPSGYLWVRGMKDAGEETIVVKKEHTMYGGIYDKIRHPQAVGELPFWWVFAFLCHSPFLALFSFVWVPIFAAMCRAEERDLLIRYGAAYRQYMERTGAFFPRLGQGAARSR